MPFPGPPASVPDENPTGSTGEPDHRLGPGTSRWGYRVRRASSTS